MVPESYEFSILQTFRLRVIIAVVLSILVAYIGFFIFLHLADNQLANSVNAKEMTLSSHALEELTEKDSLSRESKLSFATKIRSAILLTFPTTSVSLSSYRDCLAPFLPLPERIRIHVALLDLPPPSSQAYS